MNQRIGVNTQGMSDEEKTKWILKENEVNFKRQETDYAVKDEHD